MAGVVRMMLVSGGSNFLTSLGSSGVNVANWNPLINYSIDSGLETDQLYKFDRHPIVPAVYQQLE